MRGNLKAERARNGLSAREVADLVGVSEGSVLNWEQGISEPRATSLLKLAQIYRCTPDYLLGLTTERNGKYAPTSDLVRS